MHLLSGSHTNVFAGEGLLSSRGYQEVKIDPTKFQYLIMDPLLVHWGAAYELPGSLSLFLSFFLSFFLFLPFFHYLPFFLSLFVCLFVCLFPSLSLFLLFEIKMILFI